MKLFSCIVELFTVFFIWILIHFITSTIILILGSIISLILAIIIAFIISGIMEKKDGFR